MHKLIKIMLQKFTGKKNNMSWNWNLNKCNVVWAYVENSEDFIIQIDQWPVL
jgi:hypothetical protein